jgi:hypothetical protein
MGPSDKLQFIDNPPLPSKCVVCSNDWMPHKRFIDFGASVDYYGAILICEDCAINLVDLLGFEDKTVAIAYKEKYENREKVLAMQRKKIEDLEHVVRTLNIRRYGNPESADSVSASEVRDSESEESEREPANSFS